MSLTKTLLGLTLLLGTALSAQAADMQYISREDLKNILTSGKSEYLVLDVRKTADYEKAHIAGAASADLDPAMGVTGSNATGIKTLKQTLKENVGNETGAGKKMVILCYSGARYAQKATELLAEIGADLAAVYTLQGGYKAWTAEDAGSEYKGLLINDKEPGTPVK